MKKFVFILIFSLILSLGSNHLFGQGPPDPPGDPSVGGGPVGGSAPIGEGIALMMSLGAAYGGWKYKRNLDEKTDF